MAFASEDKSCLRLIYIGLVTDACLQTLTDRFGTTKNSSDKSNNTCRIRHRRTVTGEGPAARQSVTDRGEKLVKETSPERKEISEQISRNTISKI